MTEYYTMESVRNVIVSKNYEVIAPKTNSVPLPDWNRYPCKIIKKCENNNKKAALGM
jgi:hypothetical protein